MAMSSSYPAVAQESLSADAVVIDVGIAPGTFGTRANAINNHGDIAGVAWLTRYWFYLGTPIIWTRDGGFHRILQGNQLGQAVDINDQRQVVGTFDAEDGSTHGFLWSAEAGLVDLWYLLPTAINNRGTIVGQCWVGEWRACVSKNGDVKHIPLPGYNGEARAVNNLDEVTGLYQSPESPSGNAFLWSEARGLVTFQPRGEGIDVNDSGIIIGHEHTGGVGLPTIWRSRPTQEAIVPLGDVWGTGVALSNRGLALMSVHYGPRVWDLRTRRELPVCPCNAEFAWASDINDRRQVALTFSNTKYLTGPEDYYYEDRIAISTVPHPRLRV